MKFIHRVSTSVLAFLGFATLVLLLGACVPTGTATQTPVEAPDCLPADLAAPVNLQPNDTSTLPGDTLVLTTLTPTFSWEYLDDCDPTSFAVEIFQPYPNDPLPPSLGGSTVGSVDSFMPAAALTAGAMYTWRVTAYSGSDAGPVSEPAVFMTGPLCMDPYAAEYPAPVLLAPEEGAVITTGSDITFSDGTTTPTVTFYMIWDDPAECLPEDGYLVQLSSSPSFPDDPLQTFEYNMDYRTVMLFFFPPGSSWTECTPYYWRVQAKLPGGSAGPFSEVRSLTFNTHALDCTALPTPVPTATPVDPVAHLNQNSTCRSGPTLDHNVLDFPTEGSSFRVAGRNQQGTWWWIFNDRINAYCWISGKVVDVNGSRDDLPVITPIAPEVPEPTDTPLVGCWVVPQGQQVPVCTVPCPPNARNGGSCRP